MRKIIAIVSFLMLLGQVGNLELELNQLNGQAIIKLIILLIIFIVSSNNSLKIKKRGELYVRKVSKNARNS